MIIDINGRQSSQLISYDEAYRRFQRYLGYFIKGATPVYEVRSFSLADISGIKKALGRIKHGSAIWQHTDQWHVAAIYIDKGEGFRFSRKVTNLFAHDVISEEQFKQAWEETNGPYDWGVFPRKPGSAATHARKKQASYIVADRNKPENEQSSIEGSFKRNEVHRTHLISSQVTGIEYHKGLLIDYDGWLNVNPMNQFESEMLDLSNNQDLVWTATIWLDNQRNLHWRYRMFNSEYQLIAEKEWVDDRWSYIWRYDAGIQDKLTKKE